MQPTPGLAFGPFVVLPSRRELLRDGLPVSLTPKAFDTLMVLLEHRDRVVSKQELLRRVWPEVAVSDASLTQQVFFLRRALNGDDESDGERYVATVSRHGYRFVAEVTEQAGRAGDGTQPLPGLATNADKQEPRRFGPLWLLSGVLAIASLAITIYFVANRHPEPRHGWVFTQVTADPDVESYPTLSPDGRWLAYAVGPLDYSGSSDIYLRGVGDRNGVNLTADSAEADTQPAFSPDGTEIAFRSNRDGGGLFVMRRSGESVRRLTTFGFNPSWSPDSRSIAFSTQSMAADPIFRGAFPAVIWIADTASGSGHAIGRGLQPAWSPHGQRIAYVDSGAIWTMKTDGSDVQRVTDSWATWSATWSPDGHWLYFSGPNGDTMNVWRMPMDENRGRGAGRAEPLNAPTTFAAHLSVSSDGTRIAFAAIPAVANVRHFEFDPIAERVVAEQPPVTRGSWSAVYPAASPDGRSVAFHSGLWREDIYVARVDGSGLRRLTDDADADRAARWDPNGRRLSFFSDRGGSWNTWVINVDGSRLRRVTSGAPTLSLTWAPDGIHAAVTEPQKRSYIFEPDRPVGQQRVDVLPEVPGGGVFQAQSWADNPLRLVGGATKDGERLGLFVWFVAERRYQRIASIGSGARWLADGRRVMVAADARLLIVDTETGDTREVLSLAPDRVAGPSGGSFDLSRDSRHIYVSPIRRTGDIWMADMSHPRE